MSTADNVRGRIYELSQRLDEIDKLRLALQERILHLQNLIDFVDFDAKLDAAKEPTAKN